MFDLALLLLPTLGLGLTIVNVCLLKCFGVTTGSLLSLAQAQL